MEIGLKERLIGAVVLVILGVIIIPFFLKGSPAPDTAVNQAVTLPPGGGTAVQQVTLPLTAAPASTGAAPAATTHVAAAPASSSAPKPAVHPIPRSAPAAALPQPEGKWLVQAGSYGSEANADKVVKTLEQHGFHASVSRIVKSGHSYYRVRVGPYEARADADKAATAVAKAYAGKAEVVPND